MNNQHVTVNNVGETIFSTGVIILLFLFFPIGVLVLIVRTIRKWKDSKTERERVGAQTKSIDTDTENVKTEAIARYFALYQSGIISKDEFEAKKRSILTDKKTKLLNN